jgi:outer membrane lipoprotein-sorting protein
MNYLNIRRDVKQGGVQRPSFLKGFLCGVMALWIVMGPRCGVAAPLTAPEIVDRLDNLYRGGSSQGRMAMRITTQHWHRNLSLEFWSKGRDRMLIKVLEPAEERGVALLRQGPRVWNYLPKVKRLVTLPLSTLSTSCLGSHFTYEDMLKVRPMSQDYQCDISFTGQRLGQDVVEVTCIPKPGAPVVWGKVTILVRQADNLPLTVRSYDEDLKLARVMTFEQIKNLGGRLLPSKLEVVPQDKPGERTVVVYEAITFDLPLSDSLFTPAHLEE